MKNLLKVINKSWFIMAYIKQPLFSKVVTYLWLSIVQICILFKINVH